MLPIGPIAYLNEGTQKLPLSRLPPKTMNFHQTVLTVIESNYLNDTEQDIHVDYGRLDEERETVGQIIVSVLDISNANHPISGGLDWDKESGETIGKRERVSIQCIVKYMAYTRISDIEFWSLMNNLISWIWQGPFG